MFGFGFQVLGSFMFQVFRIFKGLRFRCEVFGFSVYGLTSAIHRIVRVLPLARRDREKRQGRDREREKKMEKEREREGDRKSERNKESEKEKEREKDREKERESFLPSPYGSLNCMLESDNEGKAAAA